MEQRHKSRSHEHLNVGTINEDTKKKTANKTVYNCVADRWDCRSHAQDAACGGAGMMSVRQSVDVMRRAESYDRSPGGRNQKQLSSEASPKSVILCNGSQSPQQHEIYIRHMQQQQEIQEKLHNQKQQVKFKLQQHHLQEQKLHPQQPHYTKNNKQQHQSQNSKEQQQPQNSKQKQLSKNSKQQQQQQHQNSKQQPKQPHNVNKPQPQQLQKNKQSQNKKQQQSHASKQQMPQSNKQHPPSPSSSAPAMTPRPELAIAVDRVQQGSRSHQLPRSARKRLATTSTLLRRSNGFRQSLRGRNKGRKKPAAESSIGRRKNMRKKNELPILLVNGRSESDRLTPSPGGSIDQPPPPPNGDVVPAVAAMVLVEEKLSVNKTLPRACMGKSI